MVPHGRRTAARRCVLTWPTEVGEDGEAIFFGTKTIEEKVKSNTQKKS